MKAFLLAAGLGTRLRPLTNTMPKCMISICGKPMLQWWTELFAKHGISDVLINTHYLPDPVREYIKRNNNSNSGVKYTESYEIELIGSGGTVRNNEEYVAGEENFIIAYADNLTNMNLSALTEFHKSKEGVLTMALFHTNRPNECGIATLDNDKRIIEFIEKPAEPKSDLANAGIYVTDNRIFDYMNKDVFLDFGKDVLPNLIGEMYGWENNDYLIDIGTTENYEKAQKEWKDLGY